MTNPTNTHTDTSGLAAEQMTNDEAARRGILLANLGSPDHYDRASVKRYLNQFLMDPYVIDLPWPLRRLVVSIILRTRPGQSAEAYRSIWRADPPQSPLIHHSQEIADALQERTGMPVELGMRYGLPSLETSMQRLKERVEPSEVLLIPLYPQHADSTCTTVVEAAHRALKRTWPSQETNSPPVMRVAKPFFDEPRFVAAMRQHLLAHLPPDTDHVLFSFHGLPERHLTKADPTGGHCLARPDCCEVPSPAHATCYRHQCFVTARALADAITAPSSVSFQSRLGRLPWLRPYTDEVLPELAVRGVRRLAVFCPAFVADNLETLEEIGIRGRETFLDAGGETLTLVPCLNDSPGFVDAMAHWLDAPERFALA